MDPTPRSNPSRGRPGAALRGTAARLGVPEFNLGRLRPRIRKRTVAMLAMLVLIAGAIFTWTVLRQTALIRQTLEMQLSESFGAQVSIDQVEWDGWDTIVAEGMTLRVPGWPAPADEVASIRRAVVTFKPMGLLGGNLDLKDMEIDGLTLRIVERTNGTPSFNFLALRPRPGTGRNLSQPRKAMLRDVHLEMGLVRDDQMEITARRAFAGSFEHVPDDPALYAFKLTQAHRSSADGHHDVPLETSGAPEDESRVRIFGTWDERTFAYEATLDSLPVDHEVITLLPLKVRTWAQNAQLTGMIDSAHLVGNPLDPVAYAELRVRDVTFRERESVRAVPWARMVGDEVTPIRGDVTVRVPRGVLTVRGPQLELSARAAQLLPGGNAESTGAVVIPVSFTLRADTNVLATHPFNWEATQEWLSGALHLTPFDLRVTLSGVNATPLPDGRPRPVELPQVAIDALRDLGARDWMADVDLAVSRAQPILNEDGTLQPAPLAMSATLSLSDGTVRYRGFPYELNQVKGQVAFDGHRVQVNDLTGRGAGDSQLRVDGWVRDLDAEPAYTFQFQAKRLPVDDRLLDSFRGDTARIFEGIFDRAAFRQLQEAGLVQEDLAPGGLVEFDMRLTHDPRTSPNVVLTGSVDVHRANVLLDAFPYPLQAQGRLVLEDEAVVLPSPGLHATTPGGGVGTVTGRVNLPRVGDGRRVDTQLVFDFAQERFSPLLLAAIPPSFTGSAPPVAGWPGHTHAPTAQLLQALGVQGTLRILGRVETQPDDKDAVFVTVDLAAGAITPAPELPRVLRRIGLSWPAQMALTDLHGRLVIAPTGLQIHRLQATHGGGTAVATGSFTPDGEEGSLEVTLSDFPLSRDLIGVAEGADLTMAYRAWDALQPQGSFDGAVHWKKTPQGASTTAQMKPRAPLVAGTQELLPRGGDITYRDGLVQMNDLQLAGHTPAGGEILIRGNGQLVGPEPDFRATAQGLELDSPLVDAGLRAGGQEDVADWMRQWSLGGALHARLDVGAAAPEGPWRLQVTPQQITGVHQGQPFALQMRQGTMQVDSTGVRFHELRADVADGWIGLHGQVGPAGQFDPGTRGELTLAMQLQRWSPDVHALLPIPARDALEGIAFGAEAPVTTEALRIALRSRPETPLDVHVHGHLDIARGTFRAGTTFTEADGHLDIDLRTRNGNPHGHIGLNFERLFVVERQATQVSAMLRFDGEQGTVDMQDLEGQMYEGRLAGRARAVLGAGYAASVSFANVRFAPFSEAPELAPSEQAAGGEHAGVMGPGTMRGSFHLSGKFGQPELQRGTGHILVNDARMMEFPLGMSILQLSQLMLPLNTALDRADVEFEIMGQVLTFERFTLASSTLRLEGSGSLSLNNGDLALRFRNRGTLPLVSDLFGAVVGDQMFMIDVGGTLRDPQPRLVPIPIFSPEPALPPAAHTAQLPSRNDV